MTLRRKMGLQIAAMIVGLLVVSGTALWGLNALHENYGLAAAGYQQLRQVYEVGSHLATARTLLVSEHPDRARARSEVQNAAELFDHFLALPSLRSSPGSTNDYMPDLRVKTAILMAIAQLAIPPEQAAGEDIFAADSRAISTAIGQIGIFASNIRTQIELWQKSASHKHDVTVKAVAGVSAMVIVAAVLLGILQYHGVMTPLSGLRAGVRRIASGQFADRLSLKGGEEFAELTDEFNRMAGELDGFYHQLEEKVARKSKELIRSERLASVGYLAAGVAHEINNPLGIISGYAELSLKQLKSQSADSNGQARNSTAEDEVVKSLQIICDEAFRCKDITTKLLSLARQGDEFREPVCLADVADKVVSIMGGLREYGDRKLIVNAPSEASERRKLIVNAVEAEMKQVVLNLTLNALEASPRGNGEVHLTVSRHGEVIELSVSDNGRGMDAPTLERIFEPFFTEKRGSADARLSKSHGTGLGLSITHAIIESHGGGITAASNGIGKGSQFVIRLPAPVSVDNRIN